MVHASSAAVATADGSLDPSAGDQGALLDSLMWFTRVSRSLGAQVRHELGLPSGGLSALQLLQRSGAPSVSDVAVALGVDQSVASRQVAWLVECGYAERVVSPDDRRVRALRLTDEGRELERRVRVVSGERVRAATADWADDDVRMAGLILARLAEALHRTVGTGPPL